VNYADRRVYWRLLRPWFSLGAIPMECKRFPRFVAALALLTLVSVGVAAAQNGKPIAAVTPAPRPDAGWQQRYKDMNARVKQGNVDLIFIGDSITHAWETAGKDVWQKFYAKRNAVNLGISGDQTGHVLWRLDHGNIDGISPKLAVIMIGTNNAGHEPHQPAEQIAQGIKAIVERLRAKLPKTKILLLAIFPRGADNKDPIRQINVKTNEIIAKLADGKTVFYLDIGPKFAAADGTLSKDVMPDLLHLTPKSYQTWADAIEPTVAVLMGEKQASTEVPRLRGKLLHPRR
jgi:lysophospholipase L1-like esterase